jgi:hypothetical protein
MPVSWIHQLGKDKCVRLGELFGMELNGTEELDQLRKMLKEKWRLIEMVVPSERMLGESKAGGQGSSGNERSESGEDKAPKAVSKMNSKVLFEFMVKVTDPESVLEFLLKAQEIWKLSLVTDAEFLTHVLQVKKYFPRP